ncbi:MAG: hypothetical protein A2749_00340 [Parcubacteria group bacterium RIFCSPHIGHO2_01_FULL_45_26]|nr:MAG: hypothetical protein A2749_00340 [Parcubacteria group bacterium RIFCSPHIGHO2_01_FULL_45_26]
MVTVMIPQNWSGENNLIAVPQRAYAEFLAWQKKIKSIQTFKPTAKEIRELGKARKDFANGKFITLDNLKHELASNSSSAR